MAQLTKLFAGASLGQELDRDRDAGLQLLDDIPDGELLRADEDAWVEGVLNKVRRQAPALDLTSAILEEGPAGGFTLAVPFTGDHELLELRPTIGMLPTALPPLAEIDGDLLRVELLGESDDPDAEAKTALAPIEKMLILVRRAVDDFNSDVEKRAREIVNSRRERALQRREFLKASPFPVRRRADAPSLYRGPMIKRKAPTPTRAKKRPVVEATVQAQARPAMPNDLYEHIVEIVRAAGNAMTRAPSTYAGWHEEDRRQALLLMLNSHYHGAAQAEAFNASGKTDILVRIDDVNVFVAECKIWDGPKKAAEAVDQLLSYATWHDTKLAMVFFVGSRKLTSVLESGAAMLEAHDSFLGWEPQPEAESERRCRIHLAGDEHRMAIMHVFFIHTPAPHST